MPYLFPVINDKTVTRAVEEAVVEALGEEIIERMKPSMGGEDFSAYQQVTPGTFLFIDAGSPDKGAVYPHHHPRFTIDENALAIGVPHWYTAHGSCCTVDGVDSSIVFQAE